MARQSERSRRTPRDPVAQATRRANVVGRMAARAWQPAAELGMLLADPIYWGWNVPRGDGHPVLVLPGLLGGDTYLGYLREWLGRTGYTPVRSGIDRNPGWSEELVQDLTEIAATQFGRGKRRVTIIGHSMGGVLGRSVAVRRPDLVEHVIALGSPLSMTRGRLPENVRMTAVYSKADTIVRHPSALERDPRAKNIEVRGSHIGMAFNPEVYRVLARILPNPVH